mgnify:CR=1 FL=1
MFRFFCFFAVVCWFSGCGGGDKGGGATGTNAEKYGLVSPLDMAVSNPDNGQDMPLVTWRDVAEPGTTQLKEVPESVPMVLMHQPFECVVTNRTGEVTDMGTPGVQVTELTKNPVVDWCYTRGYEGRAVIQIWKPGPKIVWYGLQDETGKFSLILSSRVVYVDWAYFPDFPAPQ